MIELFLIDLFCVCLIFFVLKGMQNVVCALYFDAFAEAARWHGIFFKRLVKPLPRAARKSTISTL